ELARKQTGTPTAPMITPATDGPTTAAPLNTEELSAIAFIRSCLPTISTTKDWRAGTSKALMVPVAAAAIRTSQYIAWPLELSRKSEIRESVIIKAPAERVWAVVQEDVVHAPQWTTNLEEVEKLDSGAPRAGTRYRYHLDLPGGIKETLDVQQDVFTKPKHCSGR